MLKSPVKQRTYSGTDCQETLKSTKLALDTNINMLQYIKIMQEQINLRDT